MALAVEGDDEPLLEADHEAFRQTVAGAIARAEQWCDPDFPAAQISIAGKETSAAAPAPAPPPPPPPPGTPAGAMPLCACGLAAIRSTVKRDTPNHGRAYWHCERRKCGFFGWVDGGAVAWRGGERDRTPLEWARMEHEMDVVSDYGFRADDLRQGGVGDCWFMSALAVVAERHDLIAKLFSAGTARNSAGCYCIRLFLDGRWRVVVVDDRLPITPKPRREHLAFGSRLAFCRCADAMGKQQLWASLVEKAYAKSHGSYQAISGGHVAEALLDLTGAPADLLDFSSGGFDPMATWARLRAYRALRLPMGCGTESAQQADLNQVGLVGGHAYSILDVRETYSPSARETVRLLRIRNPHGCGEWNGEWSDDDPRWRELLESNGGGGSQGGAFERTGVDDGTFWLSYTHFLQGFSHVDVCFAFDGWHARSFANAFPADKKSPRRLCATSLMIRPAAPATVFITALQPTKRGAWCRADRKRSYKLGDLSVIVCRLGELSGKSAEIAELVGGGLRGAERGEHPFCARLADVNSAYVLLALNLGAPPAAAETTKGAPFSVRIWSSAPLSVEAVTAEEDAEKPAGGKLKKSAAGGSGGRGASGAAGRLESLSLDAMHMLLLADTAATPPPRPTSWADVDALARMLTRPEHAPLLLADGGGSGCAPRFLIRQAHDLDAPSWCGRCARVASRLAPDVIALTCRAGGMSVVCLYHGGDGGGAVTVEARARTPN